MPGIIGYIIMSLIFGKKIKKYSHLAVLIIGFPNEEIPKLVLDVQFADSGVATNKGKVLSSLPVVQGTTNAIVTRWNTLYAKNTKLFFDGTNFFYVPYTKEDAIGNAMQGMFQWRSYFLLMEESIHSLRWKVVD